MTSRVHYYYMSSCSIKQAEIVDINPKQRHISIIRSSSLRACHVLCYDNPMPSLLTGELGTQVFVVIPPQTEEYDFVTCKIEKNR